MKVEEQKKEKLDKRKKRIAIGLVIILLIAIAILGWIIYKLLHKEPEDRGASEGIVVANENEPEEESPTFTTDMNMTWFFPSGKRTSVNADIGNAEENEYKVYFEVYMDDEEQTLLYSSPVIPIGKRLKKLKLDKALPDGEHNAICTFHLLENDNPEEEVSRVSFEVSLIFGDY